jgi:hypothetical protein
MTWVARLSLAWRLLRGVASPPPCARCEVLERDVANLKYEAQYWREREERTLDRLLEVKQVSGVATAPRSASEPAIHRAFRAMQMTEMPSPPPGQEAMTSARTAS